jgi:hypothetical protein
VIRLRPKSRDEPELSATCVVFWVDEAMSFVNDRHKILVVPRRIGKARAQVLEQLQIAAPL